MTEPNAPREDEDPWLTLPEIAKEMRVNPSTVRWWVSSGKLTATRGGARRWLVRRSDVERMKHGGAPSPQAFDPYSPASLHPGESVQIIDPWARDD